tara:strand:- start:121 stop:579 length:459 start_codon:yes stop_codon:yes gene_type:complete
VSDEISGPKAAAPAEASGTEAEVLSTTVTATESSTTESSTAAEASTTDPRTHRFECRSCGYVYDPAEGVKKLGIDSGTAFEDLDAIRFRCPVCRSKVGAFRDIGPSTKPSGFEENLNYGLGVNRLTPGQKNVLIFGSMALAFAFFLSLYSLR